MENLVLSNNVKKYFVNALSGIGMYQTTNYNAQTGFPAMAEADIVKMLDDPKTTALNLYQNIALSATESLFNDRRSAQYLPKKTALDRKTISSIISQISVGGSVMDDAQRDDYLHDVVYNVQNDATVENIIMTLTAGVADQHLTNAEKDEALAFWDEIHYADFKDWLVKNNRYQPQQFAQWLLEQRGGHLNEQNPYTRLLKYYRIEKVESNLLNQTLKVYGANNDAAARAFLGTEIPSKDALQNVPAAQKAQIESIWQKLEADPDLLKNSQAFCKARCEAQGLGDPTVKFSMLDVLAAAGNSSVQLITFFQTRSKEQDAKQKEDPKNSGVTKENKIGNLMGKTGRTFVKTVGNGVGAAVSFDSEITPSGKSGPWRGYHELYTRLYNFLQKDIYANIQMIGDVTAQMQRKGYGDFSTKEADVMREKEDLTKAWQTDYKPIPNACKNENGELNVAGEFINKTKARLLADKMRLTEVTLDIQDRHKSVQDPNFEKAKNVKAYLEQRIKTAQTVLDTQIPNPASPVFSDPTYFKMLQDQIIDRENNQDKAGLAMLLYDAESLDANIELRTALASFRALAESPFTPSQQVAKREMAADIFNLRKKYENGKISGADLDEITSRFIGSNKFDRIMADLTTHSSSGMRKEADAQVLGAPKPVFDSRDYKITAEQVTEGIDFFVQNDLIQNAKHEQYNQYMSERYHEQFAQEALMER